MGMESESLAEGFMDAEIAANPQPFYRRARAAGAVVSGAFGPRWSSGVPSNTP